MQKIAKKFVEVMKECSYAPKTTSTSTISISTSLPPMYLLSPNTNLLPLFIQQVTTAKGNFKQLANVEVTVILIDAESGETLTIKRLGSGQDFGDKSVAKGIKCTYLLSIANIRILKITPTIIRPAKIVALPLHKELPITLNQSLSDSFVLNVNMLKNLLLNRYF